MSALRTITAAVPVLAFLAAILHGQQDPARPRYSAGVEMVSVTATVSDPTGRYVPNLTRDDFSVFDDGVRQTISYFSAERVPVSLGLVVDASGSMQGEKTEAARAALNRFFDLLDSDDEIFVLRFNDEPELLQDWTSDRRLLARALTRLSPSGGTALHDAVSRALPVAARGRFAKKAMVIISDGNDTSSQLTLRDLQAQIRESNVLIYAVGIDAEPVRGGTQSPLRPPAPRQPPVPTFPPRPGRPFPPIPGGFSPGLAPQIIGVPGSAWPGQGDDRVNVTALRELTDDTGGRTAAVRAPGDLNPATANIADELRRQYELAYAPTTPRDGHWHAIRVDVGGNLTVRARRGYVAN